MLLDGIGDTPTVHTWVRTAAERLARTAAEHGDAEAGLRAERDRYAHEPARHPDHPDYPLPAAAAVAAVHTPGGLLSIAWSGDARAYLHLDGDSTLRLVTEGHNERRVHGGLGDRHALTACLGAGRDDTETEDRYGHPAVESCRGPARPGRLLLASDGAYEPLDAEHTDAGLAGYLTGPPHEAVRRLVQDAVSRARETSPGPADNATALIAVLP